MFSYALFCQHLGVGDSVSGLKKEICERLRELREIKGKTLDEVVAKLSAWDKGYLSKVERGLENPTLDFLAEVIVLGLEMEFADFCRYWVSEDKQRAREERRARKVLDDLLNAGPAMRKSAIELLENLLGAERDRKLS